MLMNSEKLIQEISKLSIRERIYVLERSMYLIRQQSERSNLEVAAEELSESYRSDKELTSFTDLDFENFYEAR